MTRRKPIGQRLAEEYEAYQRYLLPDVSAVVSTPDLRKRDAALKAVEALHVPSHSYCVVCDAERDVEAVGNNPRCEHRRSFCRACEIAWPCPTVQAITAALRPCEHDWSPRGSFGDEWRECFLCGKQEDVA